VLGGADVPAPGEARGAARHAARQRDRIERETATTSTSPAAGATAGGDELRLRGLPAIGRGVQGAIRGSRPGANL
jgi:hypothetical protein